MLSPVRSLAVLAIPVRSPPGPATIPVRSPADPATIPAKRSGQSPPRDLPLGGMKVSLRFLGKIYMAIPLVPRMRYLRREDAG